MWIVPVGVKVKVIFVGLFMFSQLPARVVPIRLTGTDKNLSIPSPSVNDQLRAAALAVPIAIVPTVLVRRPESPWMHATSLKCIWFHAKLSLVKNVTACNENLIENRNVW